MIHHDLEQEQHLTLDLLTTAFATNQFTKYKSIAMVAIYVADMQLAREPDTNTKKQYKLDEKITTMARAVNLFHADKIHQATCLGKAMTSGRRCGNPIKMAVVSTVLGNMVDFADDPSLSVKAIKKLTGEWAKQLSCHLHKSQEGVEKAVLDGFVMYRKVTSPATLASVPAVDGEASGPQEGESSAVRPRDDASELQEEVELPQTNLDELPDPFVRCSKAYDAYLVEVSATQDTFAKLTKVVVLKLAALAQQLQVKEGTGKATVQPEDALNDDTIQRAESALEEAEALLNKSGRQRFELQCCEEQLKTSHAELKVFCEAWKVLGHGKEIWKTVFEKLAEKSDRESPNQRNLARERAQIEQSEGSGNGCGQGIGAGGAIRLEKKVVFQDEGFLSDTFGIYHQYLTVLSLRLMPSQLFSSHAKCCKTWQSPASPVNASIALNALSMLPVTAISPLGVSLIVESNEMQSHPTNIEHRHKNCLLYITSTIFDQVRQPDLTSQRP